MTLPLPPPKKKKKIPVTPLPLSSKHCRFYFLYPKLKLFQRPEHFIHARFFLCCNKYVENFVNLCNCFFLSCLWKAKRSCCKIIMFYRTGTHILGLSTWDFGCESNADRRSGFKDYFASTQPRSGSELRAVLHDSARNKVREFQSSSAMRVLSACCVHIESALGILIQWIRFQYSCGEPHSSDKCQVFAWSFQ